MKTITGYKIINAPYLRTLEGLVNLSIRDGWEPAGGVCCTPNPPTKHPIKVLNREGDGMIEGTHEWQTSERMWTQAMTLANDLSSRIGSAAESVRPEPETAGRKQNTMNQDDAPNADKAVTPDPSASVIGGDDYVQRMDMPAGVTVAALKRLLAMWPEVDASGEPTEVWLATGQGTSSPCIQVWPLNRHVREDGTPTADVLLEPSDSTLDSGHNAQDQPRGEQLKI